MSEDFRHHLEKELKQMLVEATLDGHSFDEFRHAVQDALDEIHLRVLAHPHKHRGAQEAKGTRVLNG